MENEILSGKKVIKKFLLKMRSDEFSLKHALVEMTSKVSLYFCE